MKKKVKNNEKENSMYSEDKINEWSKKDNKQKRKEEKDGEGDKSKPQGRTVQRRILTGSSVARPYPRFLHLVCHYSVTHSSSSLFRRRVLPHRDAGHAAAQHGALSLITNSVTPATHCGLQVSTRRLRLWFISFVNQRVSVPVPFEPFNGPY